MLVWRSLDDVARDWGHSVVAIGVFDGVHTGHRAVIRRAQQAAADRDAKTVVVTFDPHPSVVVRPDQAPLMLATTEFRLQLLEAVGVDAVLVLPFDRELSLLSADEFVVQVLVHALHAVRVVVGANFRFGHRAAGDVALLRAIGARDGFDVDAVDLVGDGEPVSSSLVRQLVATGDVAAAAVALQRPHRVEGPVVRGDGRGRAIGCPTANVDVDATQAVPADAVYAGWLVRADGTRLPAAISVGSNLTFDGTERRVEAHVLDADLDLYDERVAVEFGERLRDMVRFDTVDALMDQIREDISDVRRFVGAAITE